MDIILRNRPFLHLHVYNSTIYPQQMYKLQHSGMGKKLFLMEGDEDKARGLFSGAKSHKEKERRLKRVKTLR